MEQDAHEVRLLPARRAGDLGVLSSLVIIFQGDGCQLSEKDQLGCITGKMYLKRFTSPKGREIIYNHKFTKVNT